METLRGESVGIIGFGHIGKLIAEKLNHFKTDIYFYDPYVKKKEKKYNIKKITLDELIKNCKYIILACPLTSETRYLIDEPRLKMMRRDAVIVNIARGKLINERELIDYLQKVRSFHCFLTCL